MTKIKAFLAALGKDEGGATMVEYALMLVLIAAVCVVTVTALGVAVEAGFAQVVAGF